MFRPTLRQAFRTLAGRLAVLEALPDRGNTARAEAVRAEMEAIWPKLGAEDHDALRQDAAALHRKG